MMLLLSHAAWSQAPVQGESAVPTTIMMELAPADPITTAAPAAVEYTYEILPIPGGTYGYEISTGGQVVIRQRTLPGRTGHAACPTPDKAAELAQLVIAKLQGGSGHPTVTNAELIQLGL
jgi:hypothetical protein